MSIEQSVVDAGGARLHVAISGAGRSLVLLHRWPGHWKTWKPVMERLAGRYDVIAPNLRVFGKSDEPTRAFGSSDPAADVEALLAALEAGSVSIVSYDVGTTVTRVISSLSPQLIAELFFDELTAGALP